MEQIAETLFSPDEVLKGHFNRFIAHKIYDKHVLRAVYEYDNNVSVLVTFYSNMENPALWTGSEFKGFAI